jgi:hypothetical protein
MDYSDWVAIRNGNIEAHLCDFVIDAILLKNLNKDGWLLHLVVFNFVFSLHPVLQSF